MMAHADPSPAAGARALSGLPLDVLRLIVGKLDLQDRLSLEAVDRSHRDALRELPELWQDIKLGGGRALEITKKQLLCLIGRMNPGMQAASRITSIAAAVLNITESYMDYDPFLNREAYLRWTTPQAILASGILIIPFKVLYQSVPETWGPLRLTIETCKVWVVEQVCRLSKAARYFLSVCQNVVRDPGFLVRTLIENGAGQVKPEGKRSARRAVSVDVSEATNLSPAFLAACSIALSAAGHHVALKMDGKSDPGFLANHPMLDIIRMLAPECLLQVNLLVSGKFPWRANCLDLEGCSHKEQLQEAAQTETVEAKLERVAASIAPHYKGSRAAYRSFLGKVLSLVELREKVAAVSGNSTEWRRGATAKVVSETVIVEHLVQVEPLLLEALRRCSSPEKLHLIFRNCLLPANGFRSLWAMLGEREFRSLGLQQQSPFEDPRVAGLLLSCIELQSSAGLQVLELDLSLSPADLDFVALFLNRNLNGAEVVVHLRPAFYSKNGRLSQYFFSKLRKLCLSERGARLRIVRYRGEAPLTKGRAAENPGSLNDAFISPVQQEIGSKLRFRRVVVFVDRSVSFFLLGDLVVILAIVLDWILGLGWLNSCQDGPSYGPSGCSWP